MRKIITVLFIALIFTVNAFAQKDSGDIILTDLWASGKYFPASVDDIVPMNSDEQYAILENSFQINEYEYKSGKKIKTIVNFYDVFKEFGLKVKNISNFEFSYDEASLLIATETESIYRHSTASKYYVYDIKANTLLSLSDTVKQRLATFSPKGNKVAYIIDNNIFIKDLATGVDVQVTQDGKINEIINGATDWVYEEEFGFSQAYFWSPDGKKLAYYRFDESKVKEFCMLYYGTLYPEEYRYKYPKAGEDNAIVSIHVYDLDSKKDVNVSLGDEKDQYIPRVKWTKDPSKIFVYRMNRLQNRLEILSADASTGAVLPVYEETSSTYVDINDNLLFTGDGKYFLITSESNGFNHIYRYDLSGKLFNKLTDGEWDVAELKGFDEAQQLVYFTGMLPTGLQKHIYSIGLNGENMTRLTSDEGHNDPTFSKKFKYFINSYSNITTPPTYTVNLSKNGKVVRTVEDNVELKETLKGLNFGADEFFTFKNSENIQLNGWMLKPADFDPAKKYPVLFYVYGGPGVQTVEDAWGGHNYLWFRMLTQKGYIVVSVDNRGTGSRGEAFKKCTYGQLGKLEAEDQIDAAKYISSLNYVDKDRLGMFGWSYGGYLTLLCMTKGADYFKTGIAVAPVTNWRFYDSIYTERFMGLPKDNAAGYDDNSPINHVKKLKGNLLIVHGSADDNVHYQNTMEITQALVNANKQFDMHIYTNKNHGIYGGYTRLHLFEKMTKYVTENL